MTRSNDLTTVLAAARERLSRGESLDVEALCGEHPDLADELRPRLEAMLLLDGVDSVTPLDPDAGAGPVQTRLHPLRSDRYVDFRPAGEGGMGLVYWAIDTDLNRQVAFKVVRPDAAEGRSDDVPLVPLELAPPEKDTPASQAFETLKARFLQEAWVTGGLEHPGIVPVYELGETDKGVPYYTMRFVRGERTLADAIDDVKGRPLEERLELLDTFLRVCDTIQYAHAQGVVHRDLKPRNVALGSYGEVVVLDWGLAKLQGEADRVVETWQEQIERFREAGDLETVAAALGTPGYMSPEAALGRVDEVDDRSDVYSLGAMLFEIVTGSLPYAFKTYAEFLACMREETTPSVAAVAPDVPGELAAICETSLDPDRSRRTATVEELSTALRQWRIERARRRDAERALTEARAVFDGASALEGHALLTQMDAVLSAVDRALAASPDDAEAADLRAAAVDQRAAALADESREGRRRIGRRVAFVAALLLVAVSGVFTFFFRAARDRAIDAEVQSKANEAAARAAERASRAQALAALALDQAEAPGRGLLLAAEALLATPTDDEVPLDVWRAVQVALDRAPVGHPIGLNPDLRWDSTGETCFALDPDTRRLRVFFLAGLDAQPTTSEHEFETPIRRWAVSPSGRSAAFVDERGAVIEYRRDDDGNESLRERAAPGTARGPVAIVDEVCVALDADGGVLAWRRDAASAVEFGSITDGLDVALAPDASRVVVSTPQATRVWKMPADGDAAEELEWELDPVARPPDDLDERSVPRIETLGARVLIVSERGSVVVDLGAEDPGWMQRHLLDEPGPLTVELQPDETTVTAFRPGEKRVLALDAESQRALALTTAAPVLDVVVRYGWLAAEVSSGLETWSLVVEDTPKSHQRFALEFDFVWSFVWHDTRFVVAVADPPRKAAWFDLQTGAVDQRAISDVLPLDEDDETARVQVGDLIELSPAGDVAICRTSDGPLGSIGLVDLRDREEIYGQSITAHDFAAPDDVAFERHGAWMVTASWGVPQSRRLWHVPSLLPFRPVVGRSVDGSVELVDFSPDGKSLSWVSAENAIRSAPFRGTCVHGPGKEMGRAPAEDEGDGWTVYDGSRTRAVRAREGDGLELLDRRGDEWRVTHILTERAFGAFAIADRGRTIVAYDDDEGLFAWRVSDDGVRTVCEGAFPAGECWSLAVDPSGRLIAMVLGSGGGVHVFRVEADGVRRIDFESRFVGESVTFDISGRWLVVRHKGRTFRVRADIRASTLRIDPAEFRAGWSLWGEAGSGAADGVLHPDGGLVAYDTDSISVERAQPRRRRNLSTQALTYLDGPQSSALVSGRWLVVEQDGRDLSHAYDLGRDHPIETQRALPFGLRSTGRCPRAAMFGAEATAIRWDPNAPRSEEVRPFVGDGDSGGTFDVGSFSVRRGRWFLPGKFYGGRSAPWGVWDLSAPDLKKRRYFPFALEGVSFRISSADASVVVVAGRQRSLVQYRAPAPDSVRMTGPEVVFAEPRFDFDVDASGRWLVVSTRTGLVAVDLLHPSRRTALLDQPTSTLIAVPDGPSPGLLVVVHGPEDTLEVALVVFDGGPRIASRRVVSGKFEGTFSGRSTPGGVCLSDEDGNRIIARRDGDESISVVRLPPHRMAELTSRTASHSGRWCVYGDDVGGLQVADVRGAGRVADVLLDAHPGAITGVWIDDSERWLVSRCDRGRLKFWPLRRADMVRALVRRLSRDLTPLEWATFHPGSSWRSTRAALRTELAAQ